MKIIKYILMLCFFISLIRCDAPRDNIYDPNGDKYGDFYIWRSKTNLPTAARYYFSAVSYNDYIFVMGGYNGSVLDYNQRYSTISDSWTDYASLPSSRAYHASVCINGNIFVFGGNDLGSTLTLVDRYSISGNSWTRDTDNGGTLAPMPEARQRHAAAAVNNIIYIFGGFNLANGILNKVDSYNITTDTWTRDTNNAGTLTPMANSVTYLTATTLNGIIYVIGGFDGTDPNADIRSYNPSTNTWATLASLPSARYGHVAVALKNKIYVIGGWNGSEYLDDVLIYSPDSNSWTIADEMSIERGNAAGAVVDRSIFIFGGANGSNLSSVEAYEPYY